MDPGFIKTQMVLDVRSLSWCSVPTSFKLEVLSYYSDYNDGQGFAKYDKADGGGFTEMNGTRSYKK